MPPPMDDEPKRNGSLPDPELNPMLNPTLGKNLGRWAQVYFTSPPEKREEAVQELLRELENGGAAEPIVPVAAVQTEPVDEEQAPAVDEESILPGFTPAVSTHVAEEQFVPPSFKPAEVPYRGGQELFPDEMETRDPAFDAEERAEGEICPACLHKNDAGQRFCGFCGFSLSSSVAEQRQRAPLAPPPAQPLPPRPAPVKPASLHSDERDAETWQWLHEKKLAELASAQERKGRWIVPAIAVLVLVLGGGYLYMKSRDLGRQTSAAKPAATQPEENGSADGNAAPATKDRSQVRSSQSAPPQPKHPAPSSRQAPPVAETRETPPQANLSRNVTPRGPASTASADPGSGSNSIFQEGLQELSTGRKYLNGEGVPRDHATAAKWLWKSVGKQNPDAVLLLSDLYVRGDGVPQSCDQARILLTAAAKRGSPGAAEKLRATLATCR